MLLNKLKTIFAPSGRDTKEGDPAHILTRIHADEARLARQIGTHADSAPYPQAAQRLRQIATEKERTCEALKEQILRLGGKLEHVDGVINSGKNHWERLTRDLSDQRSLESTIVQLAVALADRAPDVSDFLTGLACLQSAHREALNDLVMRADPQASLS